MLKPISQWTDTDIKMHKQLDDLISKNIEWKVNTQDAIQVYRCLVWFAQIGQKIKDSQAVIEKVTQVKKPEADTEVTNTTGE